MTWRIFGLCILVITKNRRRVWAVQVRVVMGCDGQLEREHRYPTPKGVPLDLLQSSVELHLNIMSRLLHPRRSTTSMTKMMMTLGRVWLAKRKMTMEVITQALPLTCLHHHLLGIIDFPHAIKHPPHHLELCTNGNNSSTRGLMERALAPGDAPEGQGGKD